MDSLNSIINGYKQGHPYRHIWLDDLAETYYYEVFDNAIKYNVIPELYGTSYKEVEGYLHSLNELREEIKILVSKKSNDSLRCMLFCGITSIVLSTLIIMTILYFIDLGLLIIILFACPFILLFIFSERYLYPLFKEWYNHNIDWNFYSKHRIRYNFKILRFIEEVLFQAFIVNRDPKGIIFSI